MAISYAPRVRAAAGSFRGTENSPFYKKWTSSTGKKDREDTDLATASRKVAPASDDDSPSPTLTPKKPKPQTLGLMKTTLAKSTQKNALAKTPTSKILKTLVPKGTPAASTKKLSKSETSTCTRMTQVTRTRPSLKARKYCLLKQKLL